jgi:hypothetical protein
MRSQLSAVGCRAYHVTARGGQLLGQWTRVATGRKNLATGKIPVANEKVKKKVVQFRFFCDAAPKK